MRMVDQPGYWAAKQKRYRERLKARKMMLRDSEAAASMLVRAALTHVRAALNPAPQPARGTPAPPLTTTDTAALAAMTMAFLQISTAFSDGADVLTRGLRARLSAEDADRENEAECA